MSIYLPQAPKLLLPPEKTNSFDPEALAKKFVKDDFADDLFTLVDERDVPRAKNFLDWCINKKFLATIPWPKQIEFGTCLFSEYCPRCSDVDFLKKLHKESISDIQDNVVFLEYGVCPKCKATQTEMMLSKELPEYNQIAVAAGQRIGKTAVTVMLLSYQVHRFLSIPDPIKYYGVLPSTEFTVTLLAITQEQAFRTLWTGLAGQIDNSPWFREYHSLLQTQAHKLSVPPFFSYSKTKLDYFHKRLGVETVGPDIRTRRGFTRVACVCDEFGWLDPKISQENGKNDNVKTNSAEIYAALENSCDTVRKGATQLRHKKHKNFGPTAMGLYISSPSASDDAIMRIVKASNTKPNICGYHLASWEIHPENTKENYMADSTSKKSFDRDFGAVPGFGTDQFIELEEHVERTYASSKHQNCLKATVTYHKEDSVEDAPTTVFLRTTPQNKDKMIPRILTLDAGHSQDSFAITLQSYDQNTNSVIVDGVLECIPERKSGGESVPVNFPMMYEYTIKPIMESYNIVLVVADQWQSIDFLQRIQNQYRVSFQRYSLRYEEMLAIRSLIYDGRLKLPKPEHTLDEIRKTSEQIIDFLQGSHVSKLAYQAVTVRLLGKKISKPVNGTDDLFRAMCLGIKFITDPHYTLKFMSLRSSIMSNHATRTIGMVGKNVKGSGDFSQISHIAHIGKKGGGSR